MKVGILTYHRAENYGALLQAYALRTYLQSLGHDVSFVDYWPKYHSAYFWLFPWQQLKGRGIKGKLVLTAQFVLWCVPRYVRKQRLCKFMADKLLLSKKPVYIDRSSITEGFDVVFYGSDQIWRKQNLGGVGFDDWYFGTDNVKAARKVVYAGSMGTIKPSAQDDEYLKRMMRNFSSISVREQDLQSYLHRLGVSSTLVLDPVFLLSASQWRELKEKSARNGKYILFYNLLNNAESRHFAEQLSREKALPIKEITKRTSPRAIGSRYIRTASVEDFLQLIDEAEYVVSNSFHGVAFSIIFQKQFYAVGMGNKANRVVSLLKSIGIEYRYSENGEVLSNNQPIDYTVVSKKLSILQESSEKYISITL